MSVAVRRALYGKMAGDSTLTTMLATAPAGVSKSIYHEYAPEDADLPCVVFSKASGTPTYSLTALNMDNEMWLIKAVDKIDDHGPDTADNIASRLTALLTDGTISISGRIQLYLRRESDVDYGELADGVRYRHTGAYFRLIYT